MESESGEVQTVKSSFLGVESSGMKYVSFYKQYVLKDYYRLILSFKC